MTQALNLVTILHALVQDSAMRPDGPCVNVGSTLVLCTDEIVYGSALSKKSYTSNAIR
jgi:hypothetical protein